MRRQRRRTSLLHPVGDQRLTKWWAIAYGERPPSSPRRARRQSQQANSAARAVAFRSTRSSTIRSPTATSTTRSLTATNVAATTATRFPSPSPSPSPSPCALRSSWPSNPCGFAATESHRILASHLQATEVVDSCRFGTYAKSARKTTGCTLVVCSRQTRVLGHKKCRVNPVAEAGGRCDDEWDAAKRVDRR